MRKKNENEGFSVNAIAGTHVVLLGMNLPEEKCPGILGFAIRRQDHTEKEEFWLRGYKTFESVEPHVASGMLYSTRKHPIQGFTWSDFSAKPNHHYTYQVFTVCGKPAHPEEGEKVEVDVKTEDEKEPGSPHHIHFNRGAAASQEYTRRFGDRKPDEVGPAAFDWLSRGAAEAIRDFIGRAEGTGWGLRVCAYEITDENVLKELKEAAKRTKDVRVLYHAKNDSQKKANEEKIEEFSIARMCKPRNAKGLSLSHNKVMILIHDGIAQAVLTGSTNFSKGGIYGHSNVVHICEDSTVASKYLWLWNELVKNEPKKNDASILEESSPLPGAEQPQGTVPIFSPRTNLDALQWYAESALGANDALFMTFAFGMHPLFQDVYRNGKAPLRYALMEQMSGPTKTDAQRKANEAKIIALRKMEENKFAIGAYLSKGVFDNWLQEKLSGLNVHVRFLHTKYMLVDPLSNYPLVVTGSANFSEASTLDNDENMLVIRGDTRVADIYLGEFMRMYNHYAFRDWMSKQSGKVEAKVNHLDEKDTWWKNYFGTSFAARQRKYFAG